MFDGFSLARSLDDLKVFVSRLVVYCSMKVNVGGAFDSECANI